MDWHCLGHATWLAEVDGLRLLFDPLLDNLHFGGVFEVVPNRTIDAAALRPDFIFVSHRHPDHFDLASLKQLASIDPETVVVTSDDLVASSALRLGFQNVRVVPPETTIDLDGPRLVTTPSYGTDETDPEWGVVVSNADGIVYNQVDTAIGSPAKVRAFFQRVFDSLLLVSGGASSPPPPPPSKQITLALARWHPLLEINSVVAGSSIGFPFRGYAEEIERCHALEAKVVVPSAAGARHAGPHSFMNRLVYPTTEAAFLRDASARSPKMRFERNITGATYRIEGHDVSIDPKGAEHLVSIEARGRRGSRPPSFRPLEIPALIDPNPRDRTSTALWQRIEAWTLGALVPALGVAHDRERQSRPDRPGWAERDLTWLLEVVLPNNQTRFVSIVTGPNARCRQLDSEDEDDLDWDVRCAVAGSFLVEVLDGQRHWGELLLGGMLRACSRACHADEQGVVSIPLQPLFLYEALSYETSIVRAIDSVLLL